MSHVMSMPKATPGKIEGIHPKAPVERFYNNFEEAKEFLDTEPVIGLDLETFGLSPFHDAIAVVGLYGPLTKTACIVHVKGYLEDDFRKWLGEPRTYITHNGATFDILFLAHNGVDVYTPIWKDTLIAERVIIASNRSRVSKKLADVIKRRLGVTIEKNIDHKTWQQDYLDDAQLKYVAEDISFLPAIWEAQLAEARAMAEKWGKTPLYGTDPVSAIEFEHELLPVVVKMEMRGLPIDETALEVYHTEQYVAADKAKVRLLEIAAPVEFTTSKGKPAEFNPGSHVQIKRVAKEIYGVTLASTAVDYLEEIHGLSTGSPIQEFIELILEYRHGSKRAGMYNADFVAKYCHDGWLKARFSQIGTNTGRFSSSDPNLQQIPKDKGHGGGARHIFGNLPGYKIVSVDYSQIEVRVAADIAGDTELIALLDSEDVHRAIAAQVFGVPASEVTKDQRQLSKAMSFTLLFGGGAPLLSAYAKTLGADLPLTKARPMVEDFFDRFRGLRTMRMQAYAVQRSQRPFTIRFPSGIRRVLIPGVDLRATLILNNITQGTAAVGLKMALIEAEKRGLADYIGAVVHDEIVAVVPEDEAEEYGEALRKCMVEAMAKVCSDAPVAAEVTIGDTWG